VFKSGVRQRMGALTGQAGVAIAPWVA
jgi:hypothetical protein